MTIRILLIGTNRSYCSQIKEFFELRGHTITLVHSYKDGFEKLFFEDPHITVIEFTEEVISASFLNKIKDSERLQLVDQKVYQIEEGLNPVFILQDYDQIKSLYENVEKALNNIDFKRNDAPSDESGNIDDIFLPKLLKQIDAEERTGLLTLDSVFQTEIFFNRGMPVYSRGSSLETGLARILLKENKITQTQYDEVIEEIDEKKPQKIGEILISKAYISPHDLNKYLEIQIREKIITGFLLTHGTYNFKYNIGIPDNIYPFKFKVDDIVYEAVMRFIDVSGIEKANLKLSTSPTLLTKTRNMNLGPKEMRVVQMLGKHQPLDDIIQNANMERQKVLKLIYFLALNDLIKLDGVFIDKIGKASFAQMQKTLTDQGSVKKEPPREKEDEELLVLDEDLIVTESEAHETHPDTTTEEQLKDLASHEKETSDKSDKTEDQTDLKLDINDPPEIEAKPGEKEPKQILIKEIDEFYDSLEEDYYRLLRVDENAESSEIKNSYMKLVKKFHPDKILNFPEDASEKAEEIFSKITVAYETLIDENKRADYDSRTELDELKGKASNIFEAEVRFNEGEVLLRHRNYREAEKKFKEAIELNPDEAAYIGAHGWARFNSSENKESASAEIIKIIETAISKDPDYAKNHYYLGSVYKILNNLHKAEKNFEKALEIDKTLIEAKRELRLIVNRRKERKNQKSDTLKDKGLEKRFWSGLFKK